MRKPEFLKEKARKFWNIGRELIERGYYDLSAFNLEQALQLWIKYLIGARLGDWPKTHYFSDLIAQLAKAYDSDEISEFYNEEELFFDDVESAYFTARYLPKVFTENGVRKLFEKAERFIRLTERACGEAFYE